MSSDLAIRIRQNFPFLTAIVLFCVVYLLYHLAHPKGFVAVLVENSDEAFTLALVAMAQTVPVLAAGLDLSVGALMTMVGCFASYLLSGAPDGTPLALDFAGWHLGLGTLPGGVTGMLLGILFCLAIGAIAGLINGLVVVYGRIQPIIATLATGAIFIGVALFLRPQPGGKINDDLNWALTNSLGDFASTVHIFNDGARPGSTVRRRSGSLHAPDADRACDLDSVQRTVTGRAIYAIGSAEGAAYMSGLDIKRARMAAFTLGGFFAGCGGLFLRSTSSGNADIPQAGAYTLNSIAAVVSAGPRCSAAAAGRWLGVRRAHPAGHLVFLPHLRHRAALAAVVRGDHSACRGEHRRGQGAEGQDRWSSFGDGVSGPPQAVA